MSEHRDRIAVKIFKVMEGEAEGRFAITVFFLIVVGVMATAAWRLLA